MDWATAPPSNVLRRSTFLDSSPGSAERPVQHFLGFPVHEFEQHSAPVVQEAPAFLQHRLPAPHVSFGQQSVPPAVQLWPTSAQHVPLAESQVRAVAQQSAPVWQNCLTAAQVQVPKASQVPLQQSGVVLHPGFVGGTQHDPTWQSSPVQHSLPPGQVALGGLQQVAAAVSHFNPAQQDSVVQALPSGSQQRPGAPAQEPEQHSFPAAHSVVSALQHLFVTLSQAVVQQSAELPHVP